MTFEIVKGDLFDPQLGFNALAQGVNTKGVMGAGIAVPFRERWPEMYADYQKLCADFTDILPGMLHVYPAPEQTTYNAQSGIRTVVLPATVIYNLFSQDWPGPHGSYEWLASATLAMRLDAERRKEVWRVGLPWIGCGIAKLERHNVRRFFERILEPSKVHFTLVEQ